jgi:pantothenate kinase
MSPDELVLEAACLQQEKSGRVLIGITGAPGAGKSTLAERLVADLDPRAALLPMDGFHLSQRQLDRLGLAERKGAPETFDADGLAALLRRVRTAREDVYVPSFEREIEEPIAAGLVVPRACEIVFVEGNYLLLDEARWRAVRAELDAVWFLRIAPTVRAERLTRRHISFGRTPDEAREWIRTVDEPNALRVESVAHRADLVVES